MNPGSLILLLLGGTLFVLAFRPAKEMLTSEEALAQPSAGWPFSERLYWKMTRGYPTLYATFFLAFVAIMTFEAFELSDNEDAVALIRLVLVVCSGGICLGFWLAVTGRPRFLVPRSLRPGGVQEDLVASLPPHLQ